MYETNTRLPRLRMQAVRMVQQGHGVRAVARHFGYSPGAVSKWVTRAKQLPSNTPIIPTRSSRPHAHARQLSSEVVGRILALRAERRQCAEILHHRLREEGVVVSLASVKRVLKRHGQTRFSKWKQWHQYPPRPVPEKPGILVQVDTVHDGPHRDRLYLYTLLDVCSRWAYVNALLRINSRASVSFVRSAQGAAPFSFRTVQSDHGPEFSKWFTKVAGHHGFQHRHSRVRRPTDNGHLERFNRTIQEECIRRIPRSLRSWQRELPSYLHYYNTERPHMGLDMKTPAETLKCFQGID